MVTIFSKEIFLETRNYVGIAKYMSFYVLKTHLHMYRQGNKVRNY